MRISSWEIITPLPWALGYSLNPLWLSIDKIFILEEKILDLLNIKDKEKQYKITEIFKSNNFKYTSNYDEINEELNFKSETLSNVFIIKISGIWETKDKYGITFKIYYVNKAIDLLL